MDGFYDWQISGTKAEIYDQIFLPATVDEWSPRMADRVSVQSGDRVLDVACGTGSWALCAAARVGPGGRVVGLDISPDMLAVARRKSGAGLPVVVEWHEGSVDAMLFDDASFDVVCCQLGLMFFPDKVAALREMRRVLAPGGRLVAMVWGRMDQCPGQMAVAAAWSRQFGDDAAAGFRRQHSLADITEVKSLLAEAGFTAIDVAQEMGVMRFPTPAYLTRSYAAMMGLQVAPVVAEALISDVNTALTGYMEPAGLVYPVEAVVAIGIA